MTFGEDARDPGGLRLNPAELVPGLDTGPGGPAGRPSAPDNRSVSSREMDIRIPADVSAALPAAAYFTGAVFWLVIGSLLGFLSSLKFNSPDLLSATPMLTFGRVRPAHLNAVVYGWVSLAGAGMTVWMVGRLCRTPVRWTALLFLSALLWNAGLAAAQRSTVPVKGDQVFSAVCGACHQRHGRGIPGTYPPLVASPWLLRDTYSPIRIVLAGLYGPIEVNGAMFNNRMPPLGEKLSDEEIAAALSHARSSWGNRALRITRSDVKSVRESSPLRGPWTPPELEMAPPPSMRPGNAP